MNWAIYYTDGSIFSSEDGAPHEAPRTGVQVIVTDGSGDPCIISNAQYYYFEPDRCDHGWFHADYWDVALHLQRAKYPLILFGEVTFKENFTKIEQKALSDVKNKKHWWRCGPTREPRFIRKIN
jgi:hypothetical protein